MLALAPVRLCINMNEYQQPKWRMNAGLYLGFIPFLGVFTPVLVIVIQNFTVNGFISWLTTFFTWLLYGVVAILGAMGYWTEPARNSAYNLLDIFSKNVVGLIVSNVALSGNFTVPDVGNCTTLA